MNPLSLLLASAMGASAHNSARPMRPLPGRRRADKESQRRIEAAAAKRERRRQRRLNLATEHAQIAALELAYSPHLAQVRDERHPETPLYDLAEEIVSDLLSDLRWTTDRIRRDPVAAVRAWGGAL
jgi:hypothetical protein